MDAPTVLAISEALAEQPAGQLGLFFVSHGLGGSWS